MYTYSFNNMDFKYSNNCLNKRKKKSKNVPDIRSSPFHGSAKRPK